MVTRDTRPVTALRNIGPAMADLCARAGLTCVADVTDLGADDAYARLVIAGHRPHFMAYVALVLGLQDRPFQSYDKAEKPALRARFDAIVARATAQSDMPHGIEAELNRLGVGLKR